MHVKVNSRVIYPTEALANLLTSSSGQVCAIGVMHMVAVRLAMRLAEVHVAPRGWSVWGAFRPLPAGWYAGWAQSALLRPPPPPTFHLLYPGVCKWERERRKRKFASVEVCSAIRNLSRNDMAEDGEPVAFGLGRTVRYVTLAGRAWMRFIASAKQGSCWLLMCAVPLWSVQPTVKSSVCGLVQ